MRRVKSPDYITHEEVRERAKELWMNAGSPTGRDPEFWHAAEQQLRREREALGPLEPPKT